MALPRTDKDILKGSKLMLFLGASNAAPVGMATSHSISMTTATTSVSTKDHGDFPSVIPQNITWEVTAENLYTNEGEGTYMTYQKRMKPVHLVFSQAGNYSNNIAQKGLPMIPTGETGPSQAEWSLGQKIAEGDAYITSFSINAPSGDNATMSVTFTGSGDLKMYDNSGIEIQGETGA